MSDEIVRAVATHPTDLRGIRLRRLRTDQLTDADVSALRTVLADAFGTDDDERFTDSDWEHAIGGTHFVLDVDGDIAAHASVVTRILEIEERPVRTGYVEAVAVAPARQGFGYGTIVMRDVGAFIDERFDLGALGTGSHHFYERLGWQTWRGPAWVRTAEGPIRTPDEDGFILVLPTRTSPPLDFTASIGCDWRSGDVW
jgi:aminoglycoside 2'-N-acetyltransferase I